MRMRNLSLTLNTLAPSIVSRPSAEFAPPRRERSSGSSVNQDPTNSWISTGASMSPPRKARNREALFTRASQQAGVFHFDELRQRVDVVERRRSDADHRTEVGAEAVLVGPIVLGYRMGVGPGAVEQAQEAPLKHVDEPRERLVAETKPLKGLERRRQRQRALRAEHSQELRFHPRGLALPRARTAPDWRREIPNTAAE